MSETRCFGSFIDLVIVNDPTCIQKPRTLPFHLISSIIRSFGLNRPMVYDPAVSFARAARYTRRKQRARRAASTCSSASQFCTLAPKAHVIIEHFQSILIREYQLNFEQIKCSIYMLIIIFVKISYIKCTFCKKRYPEFVI